MQDGERIWIEGHWSRRYPGYDWQPAHRLADPDGHWRLIPGRWVAEPGYEGRSERVLPPPPPPPPG